MSVLDRIKTASLVAVSYAGVTYYLRPLATLDLLQRHSAQLAAILPPDAATILEEAAIEEATGQDKKALIERRLIEMARRAADPQVIEETQNLLIDCLCAAVVEAEAGGEREPLQVVARKEDASEPGRTGRIWVHDLPAGTIHAVGGAARQMAFGSEEDRRRIRSFRPVESTPVAGAGG